MPCPEVVAVFYIRLAEVLTLFSVEGDAQVEQQNTVVGFLTSYGCASSSVKQYLLVLLYGTSAHCPTLKKSAGLSVFGSEYRFLASSNAIYHASRPVAKVMH